jgi:leucyl aminopeptidase
MQLVHRSFEADVTLQRPRPGAGARGFLVGSRGAVAEELRLGREALAECGFTGSVRQTLVLPDASGDIVVAVGIGDPDELTVAVLRDAAAAFALAVPHLSRLILTLPDGGLEPSSAAQASVEGAALARYSYRLGGTEARVPLEHLTLLAKAGDEIQARSGAERGTVLVAACELGRDLANSPGGRLTATRLAEIAQELGPASGLDVEVFDEEALIALGCGGLLGVNLGSVEPPRMVKLTYRPDGTDATARLTLVGKGILYDSGGISLKPGDAVHATMKNDMTGAGAVLASMTALAALRCPVQVTGYLMCTDNMPSGSAMKLGDVLTVRGGTSVEVVNTDAEGRLVMADALVLAAEQPTDAIVDIATLTGACLRALGTEIAGVMGTSQDLVDQVRAAAVRTDEPVWQLPLHRPYRKELDSPIADLRNLGGPNAGTLTAALFLAEFVGDVPWAHIDIAGTAQAEAQDAWRIKGATGFGTRLLIDLALNFSPPV